MTWYAPRRVAVAFIPTISIVVIVFLSVLMSGAQPRPGQEGLVIPSLVGLGSLFLATQLFHLWMVDRTVRRKSD